MANVPRAPFTDNSGKELPFDEVWDRAFANIMVSMSKQELARQYMEWMLRADILEWATDEEGNFAEILSW